jgi:hypothetical protein
LDTSVQYPKEDHKRIVFVCGEEIVVLEGHGWLSGAGEAGESVGGSLSSDGQGIVKLIVQQFLGIKDRPINGKDTLGIITALL